MEYQVRFNFEDRQNKALDVAQTEEAFNNTTVLELKNKLKQKIPGAPDPEKLIVVFGKDPLEDDRTLGSYKIKRLSVLLIVMKMPGGGVSYSDKDFKEHSQAADDHVPAITCLCG